MARESTPPNPTVACVLLAAGKGTRMRSSVAKVLHRACGRPLVDYALRLAAGVEAVQTLLVVGHQREELQQWLDGERRGGERAFAGVELVVQAEQRGTGHAVRQALPALERFSGFVTILYGDMPLVRLDTLRALVEAAQGAAAPQGVLAMVTARLDAPRGYGRMLRDATGQVAGVVEERDASASQRALTEVNAGVYCVEATFLRSAIAQLAPNNAQGELYLTDIVAEAARRSVPITTVTATADEILGVNDRLDLARAETALRRRIVDEWMARGVTCREPASTHIDATVTLGTDVELGAGVELRGTTSVAPGVAIERGTIVVDSVVGAGARLKPYCVVSESSVGARAVVGPFAHLRPGSDLGEEAHVGNFVETKQTKLGRGSKANHLSYLGDADIGQRVNVGAGTITCNYDGVKKHRTVIGDGAFIGSDSQLVAPVEVGAGAYVGAGTTVTKDVPPEALAVTRAPQTHVEGYARRRRGRSGPSQ
jgi:bifunctional UDP-N-acetylglucosamine pyrophosphorylase/glucosamine-1-phosphate N-acetyltransferase